MPDDTSDFGKGFGVTCGVIAAILVAIFVLPAGCTACLAVLANAAP